MEKDIDELILEQKKQIIQKADEEYLKVLKKGTNNETTK